MRTARQLLVYILNNSSRLNLPKRSVAGISGISKTPVTPALSITQEGKKKSLIFYLVLLYKSRGKNLLSLQSY